MEIILFFSLSCVFTVLGSYILYEGLQDSQRLYWGKITISISLFLLTCICLIVEIALGWSYGVFFVFFLTTLTAILSGVFLGLQLTGWRKLTGLLIGIGFPLIMFLSIDQGFYFDPNSIIRRNGEAIARALNEYHSDNGHYPEKLEELIPTYIDNLKVPEILWGWLYVSEKDDFTIGYVSYIDKMGYIVCKYSKTLPEWDCPTDYSTKPFILEPTPQPTPMP